jgi:uncharacterized protein YjbI with pentapeptide repeats
MAQEPRTPRERVEDLIRLLVPDWRPTPRQVLWAIRIGIILGLLVAIGYPFDITLWNWLELLIIPVVLAVGGFLFTRSENNATRAAADQRTQDEALEAYIDQIGQMLLDKDRPLRQRKKIDQVGHIDDARTLARARTLTVLARLDSNRKGTVVRFLYEAGLIGWRQPIVDEDEVYMESDASIVDLRGADLAGANLVRLDLRGVYLRDCNMFRVNLYSAKLSEAYLRKCFLHEADLRSTDLYKADLQGVNLDFADLRYADLGGTDLRGAGLEGANLEGMMLPPAILDHVYLGPTKLHYTNLDGANLHGANLKRANLKGADLEGANLYGVNFYGTDLRGASLKGAKGLSDEALEEIVLIAVSLEGVTMPNGQKYEDWLKDKKARGEARENNGSS